ncbi:hypothetical protein KHA80_09250 [Anaerobacillus sp. HL2]|nr:hypothetical protein KHA80_09250 [Anaerobacillus sp. HL2]
MDTFYKFSTRKIQPFGDGPYYCLNPAAVDHYKQRAVTELVVTICTDTRKPVGHFIVNVVLFIQDVDQI